MQTDPESSQPPTPNLRTLYKTYVSPVPLLMRRRLLAKQKVENVVHDVIESLLRYPPAKRLIESDSHISRISRQLLDPANRQLSRNSERKTGAVGEAEDWIIALSRTEDLGSVLAWMAYRQQVKQGFACLTPEVLEALMMARLGYSYGEIAARMDISAESLRSHLCRGYLTLKAFAAELGPE